MNTRSCEAITTRQSTYWPADTSKVPDLINIFIVHNIYDHSAILLTLSENIIQRVKWTGPQKVFNCPLKRQSYKKPLEQLDLDVQKFVNDIQQSAWSNTPEPEIKQAAKRL